MPRKKASPVKKKSRHDLSTKQRSIDKKKAIRKKSVNLKPKSPKTRNNKTMTESQFFSKIRSALRNAFRWWVPMQLALKAASRPSQSSNKRLKTEYQCAHCLEWFPRTGVQVDHVVECGSLKKYEDIVPFIERLTAEDPKSYQILCKADHKIKTQEYIKNKQNGNK